MEEKIKITGKGSLYDKKFGEIELEKISYDSETDQYNVNGQWKIPFHRSEPIDNLNYLKDSLLMLIDNIKDNFVKKDKNSILLENIMNNVDKSLSDAIILIKKILEDVSSKSK